MKLVLTSKPQLATRFLTARAARSHRFTLEVECSNFLDECYEPEVQAYVLCRLVDNTVFYYIAEEE